LKLDSLIDKFNSFGWSCIEIDGHNHDEIEKSFYLHEKNKPIFILANTIKGKGLPEIENNPAWHHKSPTKEELSNFLDYLMNA
jgi:transketolase